MYLAIKRFFDVVLSFIAVILCLIPMAIVAVLVKMDSKGPVLFKQKRVGKDKSTFMILKFRTMRIDTPSDMPTHLLTDPHAFITKVGRFLRSMSLDELPQLFNILKGDMSIIGPRPALWNQDDLIAERDKYSVNSIRPGLTGWAQVNGRDDLAIPDKAKLDGEYFAKMGFLFDAKCLFLTVKAVLTRKGITEGKVKVDTEKEITEEITP